MSISNAVLCAAVRTAIGTYGGALKDVPAPDLGATAIRASLERAKLHGSDIDTIVMGQVVQAGARMNPARQAAIVADRPNCILTPGSEPRAPEQARYGRAPRSLAVLSSG